MFSSKNISHYVVAGATILVASYFLNKYKQNFETHDEYDLIKKYLLNESPLYGYNRPKLWIHTKYEVNARKWKDFYSRNNTDLNQPYLHLTIKTIVNHCGDDFNICLIDDDTFSKLIPSWDVDIATVAEPMRSHFRELGLAQLLYYYGGMVVPNSFLCIKNLKQLYDDGVSSNKPFVCEGVNHTLDLSTKTHKQLFSPDTYFYGAKKNDEHILEWVRELKRRNASGHFSSEPDFKGASSQWWLHAIRGGNANLVGGEWVGVKTTDRKPIVLENLMEEEYLDLYGGVYGIYIPADEILTRPKFQWFAVMPGEQLLKTNLIVAKYLMASLIDTSDEYKKAKEGQSVVAI
jgi:hypothetical protein